jgi:MarR family transcriptional regulator, organic hydroperoxide resistance regulator
VVSDQADGSLILALHRATHVSLHALTASLARMDLTASEVNAMASLADRDSCSVGELAAMTGSRPTTLTSVLDRLAGKGYLRRELDPADRRSFRVVLTPAGRRSAAAAKTALRDLERDALGGVSDADLAGFRAVTEAMTKAPAMPKAPR